MTWLSKVGSILIRGLQIASGFMPLVQGVAKGSSAEKTVNEISDDLTKIAGAVVTVEAVIGAVSDPNAKTGSTKARAVVPLISQIVQQSQIMTGKKIKNEAQFIAACQTIGGGVADLLNSIEDQ